MGSGLRGGRRVRGRGGRSWDDAVMVMMQVKGRS